MNLNDENSYEILQKFYNEKYPYIHSSVPFWEYNTCITDKPILQVYVPCGHCTDKKINPYILLEKEEYISVIKPIMEAKECDAKIIIGKTYFEIVQELKKFEEQKCNAISCNLESQYGETHIKDESLFFCMYS